VIFVILNKYEQHHNFQNNFDCKWNFTVNNPVRAGRAKPCNRSLLSLIGAGKSGVELRVRISKAIGVGKFFILEIVESLCVCYSRSKSSSPRVRLPELLLIRLAWPS